MSTSKKFGLRLKAGLPLAFAATFFSILVTIFIFPTGFQTVGSDFSQRLLLAVNEDGGALGKYPSAKRENAFDEKTPENWVLVDLGPTFCKQIKDKIPLCPTNPTNEGQTTNHDALADTILWVAKAKPRLIVVDMQSIRTTSQAAAFDKKLQTLSIPVLMAAPASEEGGKAQARDEAVQLVTRRDGKVRYYFPIIETYRGVSRRLQPEFESHGYQNTPFPTLSCAAALELSLVAGLAASDLRKPKTCSPAYAKTDRIFSFDSLTRADHDKEPAKFFSARGNIVKFTRLVAPRPNPQELAPDLGLNAIVFIGDTREAAEPLVQTAVGSVSGVEVVMNDTRQFAIAAPSARPDFFGALLDDIPFMVMGFIIVWMVTAIMGAAMVPPANPSSRFWIKRLMHKLLETLLVGFVSSICFMLYILLRLSGSAPPDLITPLLGIVIGTYFELGGGGARWIDKRISEALRLEGNQK